MRWKDGKVITLTIKSTIGGNLRLRSATPLGNADGGSLRPSSGDNPNPLMQPYLMPAPIVKDSAKIPLTTLPQTYLYDIHTLPGQVINIKGTDY